ncbi:MAG TPA: pitrilysin family protein [Thermoplasmata archaeon]|nr:pitrilysin family protein [Thermoplasmata archaeon]
MSDRADPLRMERRTLVSGLELVVQPSPASARSFSISYVAPAGWGFEPAETEGLAMVTAKVAVGRPGRRSREEVAGLLDRFGASLTSTVSAESVEVTLWGPQDAWSPLLEIFSDAVLRPHFSQDELDRARRQLTERQLRQLVQPDLRSDRELRLGLFPGGHPYRSTGLGSPRSAARISLDALRRFHRSHYPARGSVLVVTAPNALRSVVPSLERQFPSDAFGPNPPLPTLSARALPPRRRDLSIKGQSQVAVRIGAASAPRSDPAYPELFLLNEVLGGRPLLSRLFQRIREKHGLAYHASSELEAMRWGGYWEAAAGTDPATRERVVRLMLKEIDQLSSDLIPRTELDRIRESALGSLPLELETTASAHELAVEVAYHRLPGDFFQTWPARLRTIGPQELRTVAESGFPIDRAVVVTVGPPG